MVYKYSILYESKSTRCKNGCFFSRRLMAAYLQITGRSRYSVLITI